MHQIRNFLSILSEANLEINSSKFWHNVTTGKTVWLGGMTHHAHAIYNEPAIFGLTHEDVKYLDNHPAMRDVDDDDEDGGGGRIIYDSDLFWKIMQKGWVRGGVEGDYDDYDREIMHPYGLYLEGKSLLDIARTASAIAEVFEGDPDPDFPSDDEWLVESLRFTVRAGPQRQATGRTCRLRDDQARYFMKTAKIPSKMM